MLSAHVYRRTRYETGRVDRVVLSLERSMANTLQTKNRRHGLRVCSSWVSFSSFRIALQLILFDSITRLSPPTKTQRRPHPSPHPTIYSASLEPSTQATFPQTSTLVSTTPHAGMYSSFDSSLPLCGSPSRAALSGGIVESDVQDGVR